MIIILLMDFALYWSFVMDAKFSILIIDDDNDFVESFESNIRNYLEERHNLELNMESKETLTDSLEILKNNTQIDLIIVDYNLGNNEKGSTILDNLACISNIPIVFYSLEHQKLFESINSIINADNGDDIESIEKRKLLLKTSIYIINKEEIGDGETYLDDIILKIENSEHLRGFILSKASELENELYDLIKYLFKIIIK